MYFAVYGHCGTTRNPRADVVEHRVRELAGQPVVLELREHLGMSDHDRRVPNPVGRKPRELVGEEDLVPVLLRIVHHPHVLHYPPVFPIRSGPDGRNRSSNYLFFVVR